MYQQYVGYAIQERQFRSGQRDLSRGNKGNYVFAKIRLKLRIHSRFFKTHFLRVVRSEIRGRLLEQ